MIELIGYYVRKLSYARQLLYYFKKRLIYRDEGPAQEMTYWKQTKYVVGSDVFSGDLFSRGPDLQEALRGVSERFGVRGRGVKVLELGPGPHTGLTGGYDRGDYDLVAVDPLADDYRREFKGREFLLRGRGEDVGGMFPAESFHIVYASNSLDHCADPFRVVEGVSRVLMPGGAFIVCGNVREGSRACWQGYHQHNLWVVGDQLWYSGRDGVERVVVGDGFQLVNKRSRTYTWEGKSIDWFYAEWVKVNKVSADVNIDGAI